MKPERIEELARDLDLHEHGTCATCGPLPMPCDCEAISLIADAIRTAVREFADAAISRVANAASNLDPPDGSDPYYMEEAAKVAIIQLRDEALGTFSGTTPWNPGESRGTE